MLHPCRDMPDPTWRKFEKLIQSIFRKNGKAVVQKDVVVTGRSGSKRKLEMLVEYPFELPFADSFVAEVMIKIAVDCKNYSKKVGIKKVEEFHGQMDDIGAPVGIMVAPRGFDGGAKRRASQLNIFLVHATWDLLLLAKGLRVDAPDFHFCSECKDTVAERECSGGRVNWHYPESQHVPVWGECDFCYAQHAICPDCFAITGFCEGDHGVCIECEGGCDRLYRVRYDGRDHGFEYWSISGVEREILVEAKSDGGRLGLKKVKVIVEASKWQLAMDHPQGPLPRLEAEGLISITGNELTLNDEGVELVDEQLPNARSPHYGY